MKIFLISLSVIIFIVTLVAGIDWMKGIKHKEHGISFLAIAPILISAVTSVGTFAIGMNPEVAVKVIVPEIEKVMNENSKLKIENDNLTRENSNVKEELEKKEKECKKLSDSMKYTAEFKNYQLYLKDNPINSVLGDAFAIVNSKLYLSQEAVESLIGDELSVDEDKKIIYTGKYPEEKVDLLSTSEPYDPTPISGFQLGSEDSFKIQSNMYSEGFVLKACRDELRSVKFNLDNKYSELSFNVGHIDEKASMSVFTLNVYVDGKKQKQFNFNADTVLEDEQKISLNYGKILKFEWICDENDFLTEYGIVNAKVK